MIVEEVSEGGSVPELRMTNFSNRVVLVVDGTELVGAKQNRIVNARTGATTPSALSGRRCITTPT